MATRDVRQCEGGHEMKFKENVNGNIHDTQIRNTCKTPYNLVVRRNLLFRQLCLNRKIV